MFTPGEKEAICKAVVRASQQASLMENLGERFLLPFLLNPTAADPAVGDIVFCFLQVARQALVLPHGCALSFILFPLLP